MLLKALFFVGVSLVALLAMALVRAQRRGDGDIPELNKHPERLDEMLDRTDDA